MAYNQSLYGVESTVNSTTTNLAASAVFTGTSENVLKYANAKIYVFSSHASATDGLQIQQSSNGTNWDVVDSFTIPAATGKTFGVGIGAKFFRIVYTNGATLTTSLRIQVIYHTGTKKGSSVRPQDARPNDNDMEEVLSYQMVYNATTNTWDRVQGTTGNVAHDAVDTGNPVKMGAKAATTLATATIVAAGDRTDVITDLDGTQVSRSTPLGDLKSDAISDTAATSVASAVFTAVASTRNYVQGIHVFRTDAGTTPIYVDFRDGTAGAVLWRMVIPAGGGAVLPEKTNGWFKTTANTALAYDVSAATTTVYINVSGFQSKA